MTNGPAGHNRQYIQERPGVQVAHSGPEGITAQWTDNPAASPWQPSQGQPFAGDGDLPPLEQLPFPDTDRGYGPSAPFQDGGTQQSWPSAVPSPLEVTPPPFQPPFTQTPYRASAPTGNRHPTRLGLTIASACIATGALILLFVSIMAQSLSGPATTNQSNLEQQTVSALTQSTPTPTATQAPTPTPTETLPGKVYIDNGRMASEVTEATGQVVQYATEFKINQKVYVTFSVHTGAEAGAVCLSWYINNEYDNHYEFAIGRNAQYDAFSYAFFHKSGPGYVELAWASSVACTDKQLAQRVTFTITA